MTPVVFVAVLCGAALNATWNAIVKGSGDKFLAMVTVGMFAGLLSAAVLPALPQPAPASWPFIAASVGLQVAFSLLVARVYRTTDLSLAYPLMRGTAPLLVSACGLVWLGERLSPWAWAGIGAVCLGILGLAAAGRRGNGRGMALALLNAVVIAAYTIVDGTGARRSGAPVAYTLWVFLLTAVPLAALAWAWQRSRILTHLRSTWRDGLVGGAGTVGSYTIALWAMTLAPVAVVAALRETSILFGLLISALWLKERPGTERLAAAGAIALGAAMLRLA